MQSNTLSSTPQGRLIDSGSFSGLSVDDAAEQIVSALAAKGAGRPTMTLRLRDWLVSRQVQ